VFHNARCTLTELKNAKKTIAKTMAKAKDDECKAARAESCASLQQSATVA
jgi:hypothetical protein